MKRFRLPKPMLGCLVVVLATILCSSTAFVVVNGLCYSRLTERLPIYPNATIKSSEHNFLSEFGMGNTVLVLTSSVDPDTVRSWYAVQTGTYLRDAAQTNKPFYRMAQGQVNVTSNPDDPTGSQIILYGTCAQ